MILQLFMFIFLFDLKRLEWVRGVREGVYGRRMYIVSSKVDLTFSQQQKIV